jgi:hypothetical protein
MSFEEDFPIGCEVECIDHAIHLGAIGTVIGYGEDTIKIKFNKDTHPNPIEAFNVRDRDKFPFSLFPYRFIRTDGMTITPIIRKIRQMEQRRRAA